MSYLRPRAIALAAALTLAATACAGSVDPDSQTGGAGDGSEASGATGDIQVSGSSTVEPITALAAQNFRQDNADVNITVNGPGTGDGFKLFCAGETDISDASRTIKEEEAATCEENGIEYVELKVAIDGISILTSPANEAVTCVSFTDLYALTGPESEGFSNWTDASAIADELGGTEATPYPDAPLDVSGPGEESGTYDTYVELVIEHQAEERSVEAATRPDYNASPNDNTIIQGIQGSDTSLGWVGYAFYNENSDSVKALEVAGEDGSCVAPTDETIASGDYPLSRPLYIYVNTAKAEEKPALAGFVDYYLSDEGKQFVSEAGYVQLTDEAWSETVSAWEGR